MAECTYCGSEVAAQEPLFVTDESGEGRGAFCNWACLRTYIDEADLATGASCQWRPGNE